MSRKENILIVDDAANTLEIISRNLLSLGYNTFTSSNVGSAIDLLETTPIDLVITDLKMPGASGMDLIKHVKENFKNTEIIMITGYATVEGAVEAVKMGADEYLPKPFTDDELAKAVKDALEKRKIKSVPEKVKNPYGLTGTSESMQEIYRAIAKASSIQATVLISGESGTGKELVARAIHYSSKRRSAPFVPVNCGCIPEGLLESELFGHIKGAFTGATESRLGFFQTADGGTIFLDEISETGIMMQVKLLRVLQDRHVCMVGSSLPKKVDVRIVAATNKNLNNLIQKGIFREDLFYRLNVITLSLPPLRERGDDIILLAHHFASKFANEFDKRSLTFTDNAMRVIKQYSWPGNVRELENLMQQLVVMADDNLIDVPDLPAYMRFSVQKEAKLNRTLLEVEAEHIKNVLISVRANKSKAAEILGIDRKTLREKLKKIETMPTNGSSS